MRRAYYELILMHGAMAAALTGLVLAGTALAVPDILFAMFVIFVTVSSFIWCFTEPPKEIKTAVYVDLVGHGTEWRSIIKGRKDQ